VAFCHGRGAVDQADGCCFLSDGTICPLRIKIVGGRVLEGPTLIDRGTVTPLTNNGAARNRAQQQAQGLVYGCLAAIRVIVAQASLLNDRAAFEAAWNAQADYVAQVRPHWNIVEDRMGIPRGSFQCSTWKGEAGQQCCFSQNTVTNEAEAANLTATAVTVRRAGGL
jgi:hypothetical protein